MASSRGRGRARTLSWLSSLLAVGCSLTLNVQELSEGCREGLVNCNDQCLKTCPSAGGAGSGGDAGGASGDGPTTLSKGGASDPGGSGGVIAMGGMPDNAGGEAGSGPCTVAYPFHYDADPS